MPRKWTPLSAVRPVRRCLGVIPIPAAMARSFLVRRIRRRDVTAAPTPTRFTSTGGRRRRVAQRVASRTELGLRWARPLGTRNVLECIDFGRGATPGPLNNLLFLQDNFFSPPYKSLIPPTGRCKARRPILRFETAPMRRPNFEWSFIDDPERRSPHKA